MDAQDEAVFRSAVAHVVAVGGPEVLQQPDRFGAMLADLLGARSGQLRAERAAAVALVRTGGADELVAGPIAPARRTELTNQLRATGLDDELPISRAIDALTRVSLTGSTLEASTGTAPGDPAASPLSAPATSPAESPQPHPGSASTWQSSPQTSAVPPPQPVPTHGAKVVTPTRSGGRRAAFAIGALFVLALAAVVLVLVFNARDESPTATRTTAPSTGTSSSAATSTPGASGSAAGEPCVAFDDTLPPGAPEVPIVAGPPPTELQTTDLVEGTGDPVPEGATVTVDYIGVSCSTGEIFDSSYSRGQPATFPLDAVITG